MRDSTWSHIALTLSPETKELCLSINGKTTLIELDHVFLLPTAQLVLGRMEELVDNINVSRSFDGILDELAFFDRALAGPELEVLAGIVAAEEAPVTLLGFEQTLSSTIGLVEAQCADACPTYNDSVSVAGTYSAGFEGDACLSLGPGTLLNVALSGTFTVSLWMRPAVCYWGKASASATGLPRFQENSALRLLSSFRTSAFHRQLMAIKYLLARQTRTDAQCPSVSMEQAMLFCNTVL